jgi:hypothetical protein
MSLEHSPARQGGSTPACYTISEFCASHRISRSKLYALWAAEEAAKKAGAKPVIPAPRRMQVDTKVLISVEAAADWRAACEEWRREREAASASE